VKAFLLAAGHGTRLRPLTDDMPKCLLPIRGKPILQIWLEKCRQFGIGEALINIHAHADLVRAFLATKSSGINVRVVEEQELLGSAGTLASNGEWVQGEECFWVFYVDVLHNVDLFAMLEAHRKRKPTATLAVYRVPDPSRCGIIDAAEDGVIRSFVEKPQSPASNLAFAGLMIASPALLDAIPDERPADIGFHVLPRLVGRMVAYSVADYLIDIGTVENYYSAQQNWPGCQGGV
jgi:mannose-1-phosphate guanylyltransferase